MDGNASMGINNGAVCSPYGINNTNDAGHRLHTYLATKGLLDHIVANKKNFKILTDAGITENFVDSDHRALKGKIRIKLQLAKKPSPLPIKHLNLQQLKEKDISAEFYNKIKPNLHDFQSLTYSDLEKATAEVTPLVLSKIKCNNPGWF
eukprot:1626473-Ditylum_brightwellii.AAC.1